MDYVAQLGAAVEDAWRRCDRAEERFPQVAEEALRALPPADGFDHEAFLRWYLDPHRPAGQQLAPLGAFGQPGTTVYYGRGFVIEIYYWQSSISVIHNHPFCGLFTILEGFSVHARYRVGDRESVGTRMAIARVELDALERIERFDHRLFSDREQPLVHALIHVPVPSISMVIRTIRTLNYERYMPPSLVLPFEAPDEPLARQLAMLESLDRAGDPHFAALRDAFLADADLDAAVRLLADGWVRWTVDERQHCLGLLHERHAPRVPSIAPALDRSVLLAEANELREQVRDPDMRLAATALMYAERRDQVLGLLEGRLESLHRLADESGHFAEDEEASAIIAHALIDGEGEQGARRRLVERYDEEAVQEHDSEIHRYCTQSIFTVLDRS